MKVKRPRKAFRETLTVLIIVSVAAGCACAGAQRSAQSGDESAFQAAMQAQDQGDFPRAESILTRLRKQHPRTFAIDESLGLVYIAQEKYAEALPCLQAAVREMPNSDVAHANLGAALFKLKRNADALKELQRAAQLNPRNPSTQQNLGRVLMESGNPRDAVKAFNAAMQQTPSDAQLKLEYANALIANGDLDRAKEILAGFENAQNSADAQLLLGQIAEKSGNFEEAAQHLTRAASLDPSESTAWALGVEFLRHWSFEPAIREFEAARTMFPASTRIKFGLGAAYFGDAKYADSIPVFADLLKSDPNNALYAELLGMACTATSESAKQGCTLLIDFARTHPQNARVATYAATLLLVERSDEKELATAHQLLDRAVAADPKLASAHYAMGVLKQNQGDWAGSVTNLNAAIRLKPDMAQAHYRLALAYSRTGRKQDAQSEIALQKQYTQQEKQDLDERLRQITTFVVDEKQ